jgi:hypothetical protein
MDTLKCKLKNVTYAKKHIGQILGSFGENENVDDQDVLHVLAYHPTKHINVANIEYLTMKKRPPFNTLSLYYKYCDSVVIDDISYVLCIKNLFGKYSPDKQYEDDVKTAFRNESHVGSKKSYFVDHTEVRDGLFKGMCDHCGVLTVPTTDHHTIPYKVILDRFVREEFVCLHEVEIFENNDNELRVKNTSLAKKWQIFHDKHAQYRLLCKSCNSRFGSYGF